MAEVKVQEALVERLFGSFIAAMDLTTPSGSSGASARSTAFRQP